MRRLRGAGLSLVAVLAMTSAVDSVIGAEAEQAALPGAGQADYIVDDQGLAARSITLSRACSPA
ncbi:MAG: hypothetical protein ABR578_08440 [Chromatocurvus sp.]